MGTEQQLVRSIFGGKWAWPREAASVSRCREELLSSTVRSFIAPADLTHLQPEPQPVDVTLQLSPSGSPCEVCGF